MEKQAEAAERLQSTVFNEVYLPRFKEACARSGITFDSDEDLVAGLETAAMLKMAEADLREQGIDTRPSAKKQARDMLKEAMFGNEEENTANEGVKSALADLLSASKEAEGE
jgi:hypothetical protein